MLQVLVTTRLGRAFLHRKKRRIHREIPFIEMLAQPNDEDIIGKGGGAKRRPGEPLRFV